MKTMLAVLFLALALPTALLADGDQEQARRAYEAGEIVSLGKVLDAVEANFEGEVIEVELEEEGGKWIYEVELLMRDGRVIELTYDAATVELRTDGPRIEAARKKR